MPRKEHVSRRRMVKLSPRKEDKQNEGGKEGLDLAARKLPGL